MTDVEVIELVQEDLTTFLEDATWEVSREMESDAALERALTPFAVEEIERMIY